MLSALLLTAAAPADITLTVDESTVTHQVDPLFMVRSPDTPHPPLL